MNAGRTLNWFQVSWRDGNRCRVVEVLARGHRSAIRDVKRDLRALRQRGKTFKSRRAI